MKNYNTLGEGSKCKSGIVIFPIKREEIGKFISMSLLMFFILFNQNILRILKDSIVISEISAEVTSFAKVYCVTPTALLFVVIYVRMLNSISFKKIFIYLILFFSAFFLIFAFVLYPNAALIQFDAQKVSELMVTHPHMRWYIALLGNWVYISFYVFAELWPNIFYVLLFWQFANEITTTSEAKRFYILFSLIGNSSLILVGLLIINLSTGNSFLNKYFYTLDNKLLLVQTSTILICLGSVISICVIKYIYKHIIFNKNLENSLLDKKNGVNNVELGIIDSFKYIMRSKYLWLLLICLASFGLTMNIVEAVWKAKARELYPSVVQYAEFSGFYILWTGITIMIMTIMGSYIMRNYTWLVGAIITPIMIAITGSLFFILIVFNNRIIAIFNEWYLIAANPVALAVLIGTLQNILVKGAKYSIWDTSIAMLYIPLDQELRTKGKAAVDILSSKFGKSGSGIIQVILFTAMPNATYDTISPILMIIFILVSALWVFAVKKIYFEYKNLI